MSTSPETEQTPKTQSPRISVPNVRTYSTASPLMLAALGLLSPGTALCLRHRTVDGVIQNLATAAAFVVVPGTAMAIDLFPIPMFAAALIILLFTWMARNMALLSHPVATPGRAQILAQAGLAFLTFWLPFVSCFYLGTHAILQRTWVGNDSMKPSLHKGDVVLVDRTAFRFEPPTYGDLVMVEETIEDNGSPLRRAYFARIVALPGDTVQLSGYHPSVNGTPLTQFATPENALAPIITYELPYGTPKPQPQQNTNSIPEPERWYPILSPQHLLFSQTNALKLEHGFYYVLEDNRDASNHRVRSSYGAIVRLREIKGKPRFIIYNTEEPSPLQRYGIALK